MGKARSIFEISGKVGDFVFYTLHGKQVVRSVPAKKNNVSKQLNPIVAAQNTEFGKASAANKFLRHALAEECKKLSDRYLYQRISKLMLTLKSFDHSPKGFRTVAGGLSTEAGQRFLSGYNFHKKGGNFPQILHAERHGGALQLEIFSDAIGACTITELQIDFENGKFRRHDHVLPEIGLEDLIIVKKQFRSKKGFSDLVFVSGERFLQGCLVVECN